MAKDVNRVQDEKGIVSRFRGRDNRGIMAKEIVWREWRVEKEKEEGE